MSWFTILFVLLLAWFFRDLFGCLFAVLGLFFFPLILAALITSIIPQIPIWVAYFGILTFMLVSAWPKRLGGKDPQSFNGASRFPVDPVDRLTLNSSDRRSLSKEEQELIDGCRAIVQGQDEAALHHLRKALRLADGAFLAGLVALKMNRLAEAVEYLSGITEREHELDKYISKAGITVTIRLPITEEVSAELSPDMRGVLLALSQAHMKQDRWKEALAHLRRLQRLEPYDTATKLALAEWHLKARPGEESYEEILRLAEGIEGDSQLEAALLLDKGRALKALGRHREARELLGKLLLSDKIGNSELLRAVCLERDSLDERM